MHRTTPSTDISEAQIDLRGGTNARQRSGLADPSCDRHLAASTEPQKGTK